MFHEVKAITARARTTLVHDAIGVLALFAVLVGSLHLTAL